MNKSQNKKRKITKEIFDEFSNLKLKLNENEKGAFYTFTNLNYFLVLVKPKHAKRIKQKLLNRKANILFENEKEINFYLLSYKTENEYLSIKRYLINANCRNRNSYKSLRYFKNLIQYETNTTNTAQI